MHDWLPKIKTTVHWHARFKGTKLDCACLNQWWLYSSRGGIYWIVATPLWKQSVYNSPTGFIHIMHLRLFVIMCYMQWVTHREGAEIGCLNAVEGHHPGPGILEYLLLYRLHKFTLFWIILNVWWCSCMHFCYMSAFIDQLSQSINHMRSSKMFVSFLYPERWVCHVCLLTMQ